MSSNEGFTATPSMLYPFNTVPPMTACTGDNTGSESTTLTCPSSRVTGTYLSSSCWNRS